MNRSRGAEWESVLGSECADERGADLPWATVLTLVSEERAEYFGPSTAWLFRVRE